jgi:hypothetical protein
MVKRSRTSANRMRPALRAARRLLPAYHGERGRVSWRDEQSVTPSVMISAGPP